jgi:hypothetical protein
MSKNMSKNGAPDWDHRHLPSPGFKGNQKGQSKLGFGEVHLPRFLRMNKWGARQ